MSQIFYCGFDLSLNSSGMVIFQDPTEPLIAETFQANAKVDSNDIRQYQGYNEGINFICDSFYDLDIDWDQDVFFEIVIESPLWKTAGRKAEQLHRFNTIVTHMFVNEIYWQPVPTPNHLDLVGWHVESLFPKTIKKEVAGKGNATKEEVAYAIKKDFEVDYTDQTGWSDLTDAHACAVVAMQNHKERLKSE